ncbi:F-box protein At2g27310 [Linum grandiflorum]
MVPTLPDVDPSSPSSPDAISSVHPDILRSHILNRLDGQSLASLSCASPDLRSLSADDHLWRNICTATWPSVNHPKLASLILSFNHGYRSFFSDSFPAVQTRVEDPTRPVSTPGLLISAVDVYYGDKPIFSKVIETETATGWFLTAPFRIDALESKEVVPTGVRENREEWLRQLEENLRVSWIVIDPVKRRAANFSSGGAVAVRRHWFTGEAQVKFSTAAGEEEGGECGVMVTCGGEEEGGEVHVREVYLGMEDMEGRSLTGEGSLGILEAAVGGGGRRGRRMTREEGKERYEKFVERKREMKRRVERREKLLDTVCVVCGILFFLAFLCFLFM